MCRGLCVLCAGHAWRGSDHDEYQDRDFDGDACVEMSWRKWRCRSGSRSPGLQSGRVEAGSGFVGVGEAHLDRCLTEGTVEGLWGRVVLDEHGLDRVVVVVVVAAAVRDYRPGFAVVVVGWQATSCCRKRPSAAAGTVA
jgi:hypothetical protein